MEDGMRNRIYSFFFVASALTGCGSIDGDGKSPADEQSDPAPAVIPDKSSAQAASDDAAKTDGAASDAKNDGDTEVPAGKTDAGPKPRQPCKTTWQRPVQNLKREDIVALINTLPKPVSIPCVLDTLPRPFGFNATDSDLSVQPGKGMESPRIFVVIDFLIITFTLDPDIAPALEFSQLLADDRSVKGEIAFPVTTDLAPAAPYLKIVREGNVGTRCAGCHFGEQPAGSGYPENVFSSRALRPFDRQDVSLEVVKALKNACSGQINDRCDMLNAIFNGVDPMPYAFPKAMPTLF
jgi:hypothetical protein